MRKAVGPPSEILASPASDYVARFVGTDRGLKRLSLFRVGELPLTPVITARNLSKIYCASARVHLI